MLIYSETRREHIGHLKRVFGKMTEQRLYIKLPKCELCKQQVNYLGSVISADGVAADPAKLKTFRTWPEILPKREQLRGFLGLAGYYRRLKPNFNKLAHPLHGLPRDNRDRTWLSESSQAVVRLKGGAYQCGDPAYL